jgi:hypothetical protein
VALSVLDFYNRGFIVLSRRYSSHAPLMPPLAQRPAFSAPAHRTRNACEMARNCVGIHRHMCDDIGVMQRGRLVEAGDAGAVLDAPQHAYTRALMAAVPDMEHVH